MSVRQKLIRTIVLVLMLAAAATSAIAATAKKTEAAKPDEAVTGLAPDPMTNPVLARIAQMGSKLYYMGYQSGLYGWFVLKDGQMQILYTTPADKNVALVGALFGADGDNITIKQIQNLAMNNAELTTQLGGLVKEQAAIANPGATPTAPAAAAATSAPAPTPAPAATTSAASAIPSVSLSPGEKLLQDLAAVHGVEIGTSAAAPEIFMIMDPNCPHCQATWRAMRADVMAGRLRIHMVPIGPRDTDDEQAAAIFLHIPDQLNVWDKYVSGDTKQLAGTADAAALEDVRANYAMVDSWNIHATPYLAYRAKDGTIKVLQGEPDKVSAILADLH